jgi:hypothetical protein
LSETAPGALAPSHGHAALSLTRRASDARRDPDKVAKTAKTLKWGTSARSPAVDLSEASRSRKIGLQQALTP